MSTVNNMEALSGQPLKLKSNRVWRTYTGGKLIESWQHKPEPVDSEFPEEWVASTVKAKNAGREHIHEGWSQVDLIGSDEVITLKSLVDSNPAAYLGAAHTAHYNEQMAVLVKVLDSSERLTIQVHPSPQDAREKFQSEFGKTEAWYILGGREINGEQPCLYMGFKPGITKEIWKDIFDRQAIDEMLDALHRIPINKGDVYLVEGGVPHAIGAGCFLIEIQEPTDLTLRVERTTPRGIKVPDEACHQNIGFEGMLDCFTYEARGLEETLDRFKKKKRTVVSTSESSEYELIGVEDTDRFLMNVLEVSGSHKKTQEDGFHIAIVVQGSGELRWDDQSIQVQQGDQLFLPAGVKEMTWVRQGEEELQVVLCYPPRT
ncbi:type I phosphomannose isomerase catalytic subunit [Paenibacillus sp. YYML68]|uniref:type I phosphomannose isomerase catalytic subunit n=1 Tax=Paenibacillus sp. YYML68 TaxID=2909250 RepID=UPI002491E5FD|nr:type I phosphomannose isomerase catalytic subunit [Paenibacillus sp. YYML68]